MRKSQETERLLVGVTFILDTATKETHQPYGFGGYTKNYSRPLSYTAASFLRREVSNGFQFF